jgi:hypothetical protein
MNSKLDAPPTRLHRVPAPNPTWYLIRGAGLIVLASIIFWRAPQFAVVGVAFAVLAAKQWVSFRRLERQGAESQRQSNTPQREFAGVSSKQTLPVLLVSRRARHLHAPDWTAARSWLGGSPRLGAVPWPRSKADGRPLPFLAQIDLAEVAAKIGPSPLPTSGALAFFVGDQPVLYVPAPQAIAFTPVPDDAPTLEDAGYGGTGVVAWTKDPLAPRLFPFWPLDLAVVSGEVPCRKFNFNYKQALAALEKLPLPQWWRSAISFADGLRIAATLSVPNKLRILGQGTGPQRQAALEAFQQGLPAFERFAAEVAIWTQGRDPWALLDSSDAEQLAALFGRARDDFDEYTRFCLPYSLDDLFTRTLIELCTADDTAYATMPSPLRQLVNEKYLLPVGHAHQMFGQAIDIQGGAAEEADTNYLLLRLNNDDMMHWGFGDAGAYHFFISPDALANRNWASGRMIFECH